MLGKRSGKKKPRISKSEHSLIREMPMSLQSLVSEGIFRKTTDHKIVYANYAFIHMFGYTSINELMAAGISEVYADHVTLSDVTKKIETEGKIEDHHVLFKRQDKSVFWGALTCRKISRLGTSFYEGRVNDITFQLQAEDKLRSIEADLAKLTMELDRFMYSASHDIRSPLSSILGIVSLMKLDMAGEPADKYIQMIETSAIKLDNFIRGLTSYARNVKDNFNEELIDFDNVIQGVLKDFENIHPAATKINAKYSVTRSGDFYSDLFRVRLILYNIIHNSFDYLDKYKTDSFMSVSVHSGRESAVIEIFDNGIGIPPPHITRVFEMFYRATNVSTGSGIGLYIVKDAVSKLGGTIALTSEYGKYTSVKIELPNSRKSQ